MNRKLEKLLNDGHQGNASLAELKKQTNELAERLEYTEFKKLCGRMKNSAEYLKITTTQQGKNKISKNLSHIRFEPLTADYLQKKTWSKFNAHLPSLIDKYANNEWFFVTLTIRNCHIDNLHDEYKSLNDAFCRLMKMPEFSQYFSQNGKYYKNRDGERNAGYFKVLESSSCEEFNYCKPHIHLLLHMPKNFRDSKNYLSNDKLQKIWQLACQINYPPMVDIIRIKNNEDLISNICSIASYLSKPLQLLKHNDNYIIRYLQQIKGLKLSTFCGTLKIINKSSDYKPDSINDTDNYKCMRYNDYSNQYEEYKAE